MVMLGGALGWGLSWMDYKGGKACRTLEFTEQLGQRHTCHLSSGDLRQECEELRLAWAMKSQERVG